MDEMTSDLFYEINKFNETGGHIFAWFDVVQAHIRHPELAALGHRDLGAAEDVVLHQGACHHVVTVLLEVPWGRHGAGRRHGRQWVEKLVRRGHLIKYTVILDYKLFLIQYYCVFNQMTSSD